MMKTDPVTYFNSLVKKLTTNYLQDIVQRFPKSPILLRLSWTLARKKSIHGQLGSTHLLRELIFVDLALSRPNKHTYIQSAPIIIPFRMHKLFSLAHTILIVIVTIKCQRQLSYPINQARR